MSFIIDTHTNRTWFFAQISGFFSIVIMIVETAPLIHTIIMAIGINPGLWPKTTFELCENVSFNRLVFHQLLFSLLSFDSSHTIFLDVNEIVRLDLDKLELVTIGIEYQ